jgi:hypothetical protein
MLETTDELHVKVGNHEKQAPNDKQFPKFNDLNITQNKISW